LHDSARLCNADFTHRLQAAALLNGLRESKNCPFN